MEVTEKHYIERSLIVNIGKILAVNNCYDGVKFL